MSVGLDLALIAVLLGYAVLGFRQGLLVGGLGLVGLAAGVVVGWRFLPGLLESSGLADLAPGIRTIALLGLLLLVAALGQGLGHFLGRRLTPRKRSATARLNAVLGGALALSVAAVALWGAGGLLRAGGSATVRDTVAHSQVLRALERVIPPAVARRVESGLSQVATEGLPRVFEQGSGPIVSVPAPDGSVLSDPGVARAGRSVVEVTGATPSCLRTSLGSGWVFARERVLTNAHVVAAMTSPVVRVQGRGPALAARVVLFDPVRDVAVLAVPGLAAPPLVQGPALAPRDLAAAWGFPGGGDLTVTAARVRTTLTARMEDIYGDRAARAREVYSLRTTVRGGSSGGPLLDSQGRVVGTVFARSVDLPQTGYALTLAETRDVLTRGATASTAVPTGPCTAP